MEKQDEVSVKITRSSHKRLKILATELEIGLKQLADELIQFGLEQFNDGYNNSDQKVEEKNNE
ncbi:MAG: hypothetical protein HQM08_23960 [Candidatus Riflebacteria bacterium]|nr:hypothetical protein [Candidatus Riflebacteria bacterium]